LATESQEDKRRYERARGRAFQKAIKLLSYRARSRNELGISLRDRGFSAEVVDDVTTELEGKGLLDDARLARDIIASGQRARKSRSRIYAELRRRGIAREETEESLDDGFDPEREREAVAQLMRRSLSCLPGSPSKADIERISSRLFRRGFTASAIAGVIDDMSSDGGDCDVPRFLDTDSQLS